MRVYYLKSMLLIPLPICYPLFQKVIISQVLPLATVKRIQYKEKNNICKNTILESLSTLPNLLTHHCSHNLSCGIYQLMLKES